MILEKALIYYQGENNLIRALTYFFKLAIIFFNNKRPSSRFVKRSEIWWLVRTSQAKWMNYIVNNSLFGINQNRYHLIKIKLFELKCGWYRGLIIVPLTFTSAGLFVWRSFYEKESLIYRIPHYPRRFVNYLRTGCYQIRSFTRSTSLIYCFTSYFLG